VVDRQGLVGRERGRGPVDATGRAGGDTGGIGGGAHGGEWRALDRVVAADDDAGALDAELEIAAARVAEEGCPEAAAGEAQADLPGGPVSGRRQHVLGQRVPRPPGRRELGRVGRRQRPPAAEPAFGAPAGEVGVPSRELVPGDVPSADGGHHRDPAHRAVVGGDGIVGEPRALGHRRG